VSEAGAGAQALHEAMSHLQNGELAAVGPAAFRALEAFTAANDRTGAAAAHQVAAIGAVGLGRFSEALNHVDAGIALRESTGDVEGVASLWQERMELCLRTGDLEAARAAAEAQVQTWEKTGDTEGLAHARHQLAQLLMELGDDGRAEALVQEALYALDPTAHARARSALHLLYSNLWILRGDTERALQQARTGLEMARSAKNRAAEIDALQQCGVVHSAAGEYPAARRALQEALVGRELLKDLPGRASVLRELANAELALDDADEAIDHLSYAARTLRQVGNVVGEIAMLQALAEAADAAGKTDAALAAATKLVTAAARTGDREAEAGAWFMLATRAAGAADLDTAARAFRTANEIQEVIGLSHEAAVSQGMLGQVLVARGDIEEGRALLEASLERLVALDSEAADTVREVLAELE
jgi:tetratricopeptide (TPR) repeat protein